MFKRGFTLLEILVVIIIIGILATLALPQYMKTIKKARIAEATSNIGSLRGALLRYYQEYGVIPDGDDKMAVLDIENPNKPQAYFNYDFTGTNLDNFNITATGKEGTILEGVTVTYSADGNLTISGF
ncbi:MAG: type IV pilin protein [Candidatus Omnitrophota bacterium]